MLSASGFAWKRLQESERVAVVGSTISGPGEQSFGLKS